jgi:hypothetical protein
MAYLPNFMGSDKVTASTVPMGWRDVPPFEGEFEIQTFKAVE